MIEQASCHHGRSRLKKVRSLSLPSSIIIVPDLTIFQGDVFLTNDPYSCNNAISHLNDFLVITPVHYQGKIVAWAANFGHFTDIGSCVPGSMPSKSSLYLSISRRLTVVQIARRVYTRTVCRYPCVNSILGTYPIRPYSR